MSVHALSTQDEKALDQPIWSSLTSRHEALAEGGDLARRYPPAIAPFAALADATPAAMSALAALATERVALLGSAPLEAPAGLEAAYTIHLRQMVHAGAAPGAEDIALDTLGSADVPAMLELTEMTRPGPFFPETYRLGRYLGIHDGKRLAAMAGERMRLDGFTEISAVCVHPDYRGKGYARILMTRLMQMIRADGDTPILHVLDTNAGAITLYERLGFFTRTRFHLTVMQRRDEA